ncbi:MAG: hypothetical protein P4M00_07615 [Azospirillaceae bacterium]|nr:hypothetical protein [Azospirillaceae bacterium]
MADCLFGALCRRQPSTIAAMRQGAHKAIPGRRYRLSKAASATGKGAFTLPMIDSAANTDFFFFCAAQQSLFLFDWSWLVPVCHLDRGVSSLNSGLLFITGVLPLRLSYHSVMPQLVAALGVDAGGGALAKRGASRRVEIHHHFRRWGLGRAGRGAVLISP